jgi:hypothetical protein
MDGAVSTRWCEAFWHNQPIVKTLVIPFPVVVCRECGERSAQVGFAEDDDPVQALLFNRPHESSSGGESHLCVSNCQFSRRFPDWATLRGARPLTYADSRMKNLLITLLHFAVVTAKLCGPGGVRAVIAENLVLKQQLIVLCRGRQRRQNCSILNTALTR